VTPTRRTVSGRSARLATAPKPPASNQEAGTTPSDVEMLAALVHDAWIKSKQAQGTTARSSEWGEPLMVPYDALSERAKDLDRGTVRAVLDAQEAARTGDAIDTRLFARAAQAEVLRAVAHDWLSGEWHHVLDPYREAEARAVAAWLRDRADDFDGHRP